MLSRRIIPCLDVRNDRITKGIKFKNNIMGVDLIYQKDILPKTETIFEGPLVYPISFKMPEEHLSNVKTPIEGAAKEVL